TRWRSRGRTRSNAIARIRPCDRPVISRQIVEGMLTSPLGGGILDRNGVSNSHSSRTESYRGAIRNRVALDGFIIILIQIPILPGTCQRSRGAVGALVDIGTAIAKRVLRGKPGDCSR